MILNDIFNLAHIMFGIENPCDKIKYIGKIGSKRYPVMSPTEFKNLIEITDDSLSKLVFTTLYFTGIRIGELLALRKDDIDFKENFIAELYNELVHLENKKSIS